MLPARVWAVKLTAKSHPLFVCASPPHPLPRPPTPHQPPLLPPSMPLPPCCHLQLAKAVENAIKTSPLSLNATTEGSEVLVKLPRMTQETIDRMVKLVHMEAEGAHQSIRRARQKGMDAVKKAFKGASQDEKKRQEKEVGAGRCWCGA